VYPVVTFTELTKVYTVTYSTDVAGTLITTVHISGTSIKNSPFTQVGRCRLTL